MEILHVSLISKIRPMLSEIYSQLLQTKKALLWIEHKRHLKMPDKCVCWGILGAIKTQRPTEEAGDGCCVLIIFCSWDESLSNFGGLQNPLEGLLKQKFLGSPPRVFNSAGLGWDLRSDISNKSPSNSDVADSRATGYTTEQETIF